MDNLHWRHLLAEPLVTATVTLGSVTSVFTCLGHLGDLTAKVSKYSVILSA
jgi:hypothetical protein